MRTHLVLCALALAFAGCGDQSAPDDGIPRVYTTFFPTTDFARHIGGAEVEVVCPLPADADPIFWEPDAEALAAYQAADLIVLNGAGFERWVATRSLPASKIVDCARDFEDEWLSYENATTHSHGAAGEHTHEGLDGHTWLDPAFARRAVDAIESGLARCLPERTAVFAERAEALRAELDSLDLGLRALAEPLAGRPLWTNHPAYNYLARRYGWQVVNFDIDPEAPLSDDVRAQLGAALADGAPAAMLFEAEPVAELRTALEALGLRPVEFAPGEMPPEGAAEGGYIALMHANIRRLQAALRN